MDLPLKFIFQDPKPGMSRIPKLPSSKKDCCFSLST